MLSAFTMASGGIRASRLIHLTLTWSLLKASLLFHESTPRGRVMSRVADDMMTVDYVMPFTIRSMLNTILMMGFSLAVICVTSTVFLVTLPPLAVLYIVIQVWA